MAVETFLPTDMEHFLILGHGCHVGAVEAILPVYRHGANSLEAALDKRF